jgi:hypothetical protein
MFMFLQSECFIFLLVDFESSKELSFIFSKKLFINFYLDSKYIIFIYLSNSLKIFPKDDSFSLLYSQFRI